MTTETDDKTRLQFISPFPLENCKSRLSKRTEDSSFLAWRHERRLVVDVWDIDKDTAGFTDEARTQVINAILDGCR